MAVPTLSTEAGIRIAVEGCGHGTLNEIYASVKKSCELKGWPGVDLLIIGGDFQAVRNAYDLKAVSIPVKYYTMHDFHEYYSGVRTAPYLTIFIGGNHEASNHMWELYYGGWAAPRIYYMGAANIVRLGPLRIAGLSGIWKGYNYNKPHHERLPYNSDDVKSIYHVRELDVRKLLQIRSQVDIGLSHDWPRGMEWKGNFQQLFRFKAHLEEDANTGKLGNVAATQILERLRPAHWFSAHLHCRYAAMWNHEDGQVTSTGQANGQTTTENKDRIDVDMDDGTSAIVLMNPDEIDVDLDDDVDAEKTVGEAKEETKWAEDTTDEVPEEVRKLLPESFSKRATEAPPTLPFPPDITNKTTNFLALDKCLPNRHFLQLVEITPHAKGEFTRPLRLEYDQEWLAITRVFASDLTLGNPDAKVPPDRGDAIYRPLIEQEMAWVEQSVIQPGKMTIPEDFAQTAPVYDPVTGIHVQGGPQEYSNPHTQAFCHLLEIPNPFHASDEERAQMMQQGPRPVAERFDQNRGDGRSRGGRGSWGGHGGRRGRGGGRGRGRGGFNQGRDRGRGQW